MAAMLAGVAVSADAATFTVTSTNTSGAGSLAQAITDANLTALADTVAFNIAGSGTFTIGGSLPTITQPLTINGYSQPGTSPNTRTDGTTDAVLRIVLDASTVNLFNPMLRINSGRRRSAAW